METQYKIEGRPTGSSKAWVEMDPGPYGWYDVHRQMERRAGLYNTGFLTFEYRPVGIPHPEAVKPRRRVSRRGLKEGTVFKYLTGWHKDGIFEAGKTHEGRPPLHMLGLWDSKGLPVSCQTGSGEMCEVLWEPGDPQRCPAPTTVVDHKGPTWGVPAPAPTPRRREYELGWSSGGSLRPELEELEDAKLHRLDAEVHAEAERRRIQRARQAEITEHNRRAEWLERHGERVRGQFSNFMLGATQAMACRSALRKFKGHAPYTGSKEASGEMWTVPEVAQAQRALGGYAAPWSMESPRFVECMKQPEWRQAIGCPTSARPAFVSPYFRGY